MAGLVHDLHRLRIPGTRRVVLPLNVRVIESHLRTMHAAFARHRDLFLVARWHCARRVP
jgi:hypothetical protein